MVYLMYTLHLIKPINMTLEEIKLILSRINLNIFSTVFHLRAEEDNKTNPYGFGRVFIQIAYKAFCTKTQQLDEWRGRKWYLSEHMTEDEVIKTVYAAFKAAVEHEIMEGFKIDGITLFNPHVDYKELLKISHIEVKRKQ